MKPEFPAIVVSQRVVEVSARGEVRDCLDQSWSLWLQSLGFTLVPVPNRLASVNDFLAAVRPVGIILSGGNNLTLPVYDGAEAGSAVADAYESRDHTEKSLVEFAVHTRLPLLGCCRGMQFLQAFFGGRLSPLKDSTVSHVGRPHEVALAGEKFHQMARQTSLSVNSFHNYGIRRDAIAPPLIPFAVSPEDSSVEAFFHKASPVVGIMWHPERPNPAAAFDRELATRLFKTGDFRLHES